MQLVFGTVNSILLMIESIIFIPVSLDKNSAIDFIFYIMIWSAINNLLKLIAFKKKYVKLIDIA